MKDQLGFYKITLPIKNNLFDSLSKSVSFIATGKGRLGNNLVCVDDKGIPIVRTTTNYKEPACQFSSTHHNLVKQIVNTVESSNVKVEDPLHFNNALIEMYSKSYKKMKYHSDQALDLKEGSYIALFSCYKNSGEQNIRTLKIKNKKTEEESEIKLTHNSVILFSTATNAKFSHKIILEESSSKEESQENCKWLGITFRTSKTYIQFKNNIPYFLDGSIVELANETQEKEFFKLRGEENKGVNFLYPKLNYTLSMADTLEPKKDN